MRSIEIIFAVLAAVILLIICPLMGHKSVLEAQLHENYGTMRAFKVTFEARRSSEYEPVIYEEPVEISVFEYYTDAENTEGAFVRYGY